MLKWINRVAASLTFVTGVVAVAFPTASVVTGCITVALGMVYFASYERGRVEFNALGARAENAVARLTEHAISIEGLDGKIDANRPERHVAAAIIGQGDLATTNYLDVVKRLRDDGHIV